MANNEPSMTAQIVGLSQGPNQWQSLAIDDDCQWQSDVISSFMHMCVIFL